MTTRVDWNEQIRANAEKRHEKNKKLWKKASKISDDTIEKVEKERKLKGTKESFDREIETTKHQLGWKEQDVEKAKKHLSEAQDKKNMFGYSAPDKKGIKYWSDDLKASKTLAEREKKALKTYEDYALKAKTLQTMQKGKKAAGRRRRRKRTKKKRRKTRRSKKKRRKRRRTKKKRRRRR